VNQEAESEEFLEFVCTAHGDATLSLHCVNLIDCATSKKRGYPLMKKILLFSTILLLSAAWAVAQSNSQANTTGQMSSDSGNMTVEGCLSGSVGSYSLTDKSGTTYQLTGDTARLETHVGHTIQVIGTSSPSTESSAANTAKEPSSAMSGATGSSSTQQTLNVTSFKNISANCMDSAH
jgi:hypothetical protein